MDKETVRKLYTLRIKEEKSYGDIAAELELSANTVKSYCLRHDLGDARIQRPKPSRNEIVKARPPKKPRPAIGYCKECGKAFIQPLRGNLRIYCSDLCKHRHEMNNPRSYIPRFCEVCGKLIKERDHRKVRKYCSLDCYRTARYYSDGGERITRSFCQQCGKEIIKPGHKTMKFCSQECYWESLKKYQY